MVYVDIAADVEGTDTLDLLRHKTLGRRLSFRASTSRRRHESGKNGSHAIESTLDRAAPRNRDTRESA